MSAIQPLFQGEVQFRRYSDTSTQGQQVVFALSSREELQPFIGLEGKRFMAVLVQIGDDEQPIPSNSTESKQREPLGDLCWRAVHWCRDPEFQAWVKQRTDTQVEVGEEEAKMFIQLKCDVDSRKELDAEPAKAKFLRLIVGPWQKHCLARGIHQ